MKRISYILLVLFCVLLVLFYVNTILTQKYKLIEATHSSDNSKDCRVIGNCILSKYTKNGKLNVTIYINNQFRDLSSDKYSFNFEKGVLNINVNVNSHTLKDIVIKGVKIHQAMVSSVSRPPSNGGYDTQKYQFKFTGFKIAPKVIQFNHTNLCNCPTKAFKFEIYKKDTINVINANGMKDGLWLTFFEKGKIQEKKYYDNGRFVSGKTFDKNGNDLHYVSESSGSIVSFQTDSVDSASLSEAVTCAGNSASLSEAVTCAGNKISFNWIAVDSASLSEAVTCAGNQISL